jgi:hypothetical protein
MEILNHRNNLPTKTLAVRPGGAVAICVGNLVGAVSGWVRIRGQAERSIGLSASFWVRLCHPSTWRMGIWPEASSAQNNIAAVSADGSTVWVLIRRLNSIWSRFTRVGGASAFPLTARSRVKVKAAQRPLRSCRLSPCICAGICERRPGGALRPRQARRRRSPPARADVARQLPAGVLRTVRCRPGAGR